ncbi:uncharacterized protein N7484_003773 [Penicillium longicatenatum]|uniref:uncharacterized protein n=1 Tax=Penicillium longicatenatum TaxID=1561947 RepID=UPI0025498BE1|nr:uncharacterized protein N7484_003773 [Penicillium longicatenatum]KAJ5650050.1 hypothetical protein N7484_003773 [Penicillium longicatenatum]
MLGLGAYDSSSEEEVETKTPAPQHTQQHLEALQANQVKDQNEADDSPSQLGPSTSNVAPNGPVLGPAVMNTTPYPEERPAGGYTSPFSASRALIQDLTLPPVPNLDIPPSPSGSPDPAANAKFEHFLSLKKNGVHFNAKLASSSSLKNPSLLIKMMEHAGIDEQAQYDTSLPVELWNTSTLPPWAFKEELLRAQQEARQRMDDKKASGQRSSIEFVSSSPTHGSTSSMEIKRKGNP